MKAPLVVFGEDWGAHPSSTQHLVRALMAERRVLWVNSIGLRRPRLNARDLRRGARKALDAVAPWRRGEMPAQGEPAAPVVLQPLAVPLPGNRLARAANRRLLGGALRRALRRQGLERPVLWLSLPTAVDAIGAADERAVVYYCGDDFGALAGVDGGPVAALEQELATRADLVLAASPALAAKFPGPKTALVPHGADVARFSAPAPRPADLPAGGRVAGFYGSISPWVDIGLLAEAARRLPAWRFFLVGPVDTDVSALAALGNVTLAGPRPHAALPGYVQHWDVSLIPFCDTTQIRACNPLKLREYLAAGTPVATTPFPALDGYRDLVEIGRTPEAFAAAIARAAAEGRRRAPQRQGRVAGETWEARARQVAALLAGLGA